MSSAQWFSRTSARSIDGHKPLASVFYGDQNWSGPPENVKTVYSSLAWLNLPRATGLVLMLDGTLLRRASSFALCRSLGWA